MPRQPKLPKIRESWSRIPCGLYNNSYVDSGGCDILKWSQNHSRGPNGSWAGGGEFLQVSSRRTHTYMPFNYKRLGPTWGTAAGCWHLLPELPYLPLGSGGVEGLSNAIGNIDSHREAARADFTAGWQKTRPGNPVASLAQFIVELRDFPVLPGRSIANALLNLSPGTLRRSRAKYSGSFLRSWLNGPVERIPDRIQAQVKFFTSLGDEYLNHVFGWLPFIEDLGKLYALSQSIDGRIKQIQRDNGRGVRRKANLSYTESTTSDTKTSPTAFYGARQAPPNDGYLPWGSKWTTVRTESRRSWFSARYRYFIPNVDSPEWIAGAKKVLAGAAITPSLVWELTPWSWMVDWFLNVGDILSNFSENAVEDLVADYAFCMINTKVRLESVSSGSWTGWSSGDPSSIFSNDVPSIEHTLKTIDTIEIKARVMGSPYGLGVKYPDLNSRQVGVLAALGISRSSF